MENKNIYPMKLNFTKIIIRPKIELNRILIRKAQTENKNKKKLIFIHKK